jgi:SAM-dependent methyltransferase
MLVWLLGSTLFVSAFLLFWCEPMVAKMLLPLLGGSASVWTTCVLFFQVMLLAGYVYTHAMVRRLALQRQFFVHGILMAAALSFLPLHFVREAARSASGQPVTWLLGHLIAAAGVPFLVVSTTAPLLQSWLARTQLKAGRDPYFLYAASNTGSLFALIVFPLFIEPRMGVSAQSRVWTVGYLCLLGMVLSAAVLIWRRVATAQRNPQPDGAVGRPALKTRLYWLAASAVPSALMLAVTTHISTDLASVPFLWIIPLAIYLLTFILAFSTSVRITAKHLSAASGPALLLLLPIIPDISPPAAALNWPIIAGHLAMLFIGAYLCHAALAARRPDVQQLTDFYFWIALGGALGGIFSAVIAPWIFSTILEYPLLVAMLPLFRQRGAREKPPNWKDALYPALVGVAFFTSWYVMRRMRVNPGDTIGFDVVFFVIVLLFQARRYRFAAAFAILLFGYVVTIPEIVENGERLYVARDFFGVKKVLFDRNRNMRRLLHGDTLHGEESLDPAHTGEPMTYYHTTGPAGDVMDFIAERPNQRVGVVGLGAGTMAAYGNPNRHITFFDVDPQVEPIAHSFFTYTRRCGADCDVIIGDGRLSIEQLPDAVLDVLMLDAFSSDSIPAHLVSREALKMYLTKLKPNGILLFHVSNRYLDVKKLVAAAITDARLAGLYRSDREEVVWGKSGSDYVLAARREEDFGTLASKEGWDKMEPETQIAPWTDDYSNMLPLLKWK